MSPRQQWTGGHQGEDDDEQWTGGALVVRDSDHALLAEHASDERQDRSPEDDRDHADQQQVLKHERALTRNRRCRLAGACKCARTERQQADREDQTYKEEAEKPWPDRTDSERVDRRDDSAAHDEGAENDK